MGENPVASRRAVRFGRPYVEDPVIPRGDRSWPGPSRLGPDPSAPTESSAEWAVLMRGRPARRCAGGDPGRRSTVSSSVRQVHLMVVSTWPSPRQPSRRTHSFAAPCDQLPTPRATMPPRSRPAGGPARAAACHAHWPIGGRSSRPGASSYPATWPPRGIRVTVGNHEESSARSILTKRTILSGPESVWVQDIGDS